MLSEVENKQRTGGEQMLLNRTKELKANLKTRMLVSMLILSILSSCAHGTNPSGNPSNNPANNPANNPVNNALGDLAETLEKYRVGEEVFNSKEYQERRKKRIELEEERHLEQARRDTEQDRRSSKIVTIH